MATFQRDSHLMGTFRCGLRFNSIYENLDFGSHIHNNRSTEELCKFPRLCSQCVSLPLGLALPVCVCSLSGLSPAFATWQNKSIIIVCHWNIVNFHQSHKQTQTQAFCFIAIALCRQSQDWHWQCALIENGTHRGCAYEPCLPCGFSSSTESQRSKNNNDGKWHTQKNNERQQQQQRKGIKKCMFHIKYHTYW